MKIYMNNMNINNIDSSLINEYKCKTEKFTFILSLNGIIKLMNDKITNSKITNSKLIKIDIIDKPITEVTINNIALLCDESRFVNKYEIYQIPVQHYVENITNIYYSLRANSDVNFVVEYKDEKKNNMYFLTNENINVGYIQEDINTFFTLLKII